MARIIAIALNAVMALGAVWHNKTVEFELSIIT